MPEWTNSPRARGLDSAALFSGASETATVGIGFHQLEERRSCPRVGRERRWVRFGEHQHQRQHSTHFGGAGQEEKSTETELLQCGGRQEKTALKSFLQRKLQRHQLQIEVGRGSVSRDNKSNGGPLPATLKSQSSSGLLAPVPPSGWRRAVEMKSCAERTVGHERINGRQPFHLFPAQAAEGVIDQSAGRDGYEMMMA